MNTQQHPAQIQWLQDVAKWKCLPEKNKSWGLYDFSWGNQDCVWFIKHNKMGELVLVREIRTHPGITEQMEWPCTEGIYKKFLRAIFG